MPPCADFLLHSNPIVLIMDYYYVPHDLKVKLGYFWTENIFQPSVHLYIMFLCVNYCVNYACATIFGTN